MSRFNIQGPGGPNDISLREAMTFVGTLLYQPSAGSLMWR
jgi:hypothetical protein